MNYVKLGAIVDDCITEAVRERGSRHAILPVGRAVNMAILRSETGSDQRPEVCRMVCEHAIRRRLILQFADD